MKKHLLLLATALFSFTLLAQVPSYVPSNGLVGYWPFNGNANDESVNGNNGTVGAGISLTTDRFLNINSAYNFTGVGYIQLSQYPVIGNSNFTISVWLKSTDLPSERNAILGWGSTSITNGGVHLFYYGNGTIEFDDTNVGGPGASGSVNDNYWHQVMVVNTSGSIELFIDGSPRGTGSLSPNILPSDNAYIGSNSAQYFFSGMLDDIGIWNRALTQQEITTLFNYQYCNLGASINPTITNINTNTNTLFNATSNDPNATYQWQSNPSNFGWQNVPTNTNYVDGSTNSLTVNNIQLANHHQPFRVIATSGNCIDTSNIATINIIDTCIASISVTDTLVINVTTTGLTPPNNINTIKVFPNPANDHITINYGNFATMTGYTLKITNALGQVVFTTPINQQSSYIDLSTWNGNGIYFVQIMDTQNNTIENRKILLQ